MLSLSKSRYIVLFFLNAADCSNQCMGNTEVEGVIFKAHRCYQYLLQHSKAL